VAMLSKFMGDYEVGNRGFMGLQEEVRRDYMHNGPLALKKSGAGFDKRMEIHDAIMKVLEDA